MFFLPKNIIFWCGRMVWGAQTASCIPLKQHLWSLCIGPIYGPLGALFNCTPITSSSPRHCCSPWTAWMVRVPSPWAPKLLPGPDLPHLEPTPTPCLELSCRLLCLGTLMDPTTSSRSARALGPLGTAPSGRAHPTSGHLSRQLCSPCRHPGSGCSLTRGACYECLYIRILPYTAPAQSELQIISNCRGKKNI